MASVIKLKRSETASSVPDTSDLAVGEVALNTADQKIYVRDSSDTIVEVANASGGGSASGESVTYSVTQSSHGFSVGDVLYFDGTDYALAQADDGATLGIFLVSTVTDTDTFSVTISGKVELTGLTSGEYYFVSADIAGAFTATEPTTGYSNPIFFAISTTEAIVLPYRPAAVGDTSPLAITEGGTGASTASGARTNLDVLSSAEVRETATNQTLALTIALG